MLAIDGINKDTYEKNKDLFDSLGQQTENVSAREKYSILENKCLI